MVREVYFSIVLLLVRLFVDFIVTTVLAMYFISVLFQLNLAPDHGLIQGFSKAFQSKILIDCHTVGRWDLIVAVLVLYFR